jgi:hypothetical protein
MEKILIIGAFDRYNYGDLLFPLILQKQLDVYNLEFQYQFFGLVESDLSNEGGLPTQDLKAFYAQCNQPGNKVHIIVAGGEALGVTWHSLFAALNKSYQKIHKYHLKLSRILDLNAIARRFLKGKTALPFVFTKGDFQNVNSVILNSLGGSGLKPALFERFNFLQEKLSKADYLAVRDKTTVENLKINNVSAKLFPDSAILMSEFYTNEFLEKQVTPEVLVYAKAKKGNYVFFQINKKTTVGKQNLIAAELDRIYLAEQVEICLCPIGKALNHDDHLALGEIKQLLKSPSTYFDAYNIWDIMYLIANAKIYIGTSLHGAITAMSYAVPHVGLKVEKLDAYLHTWGVKENDFAVDFHDIYKQYVIATTIKKVDYENIRDIQIKEIKNGFDLMVEVIKSNS